MPRSQLAGEPDGACDIDAGGAAEAKALVLEQFIDDRDGFLVGNEIGLIHLGLLDDRRDAAEPDALGDRAARRGLDLTVVEPFVHGGAARIGAADYDALVLFLQKRAGARQRAAGA